MAKTADLTKPELLELVKQHATRNYEKDGWDILIECYTDEEIVKAMGRSKKESGAIWAVQWNLGLKTQAGVRADVQAEAF